MSSTNSPKGWFSRALPHFDGGPIPQMLTFRLIDSFPEQCLLDWKEELAALSPAQAELEKRRRIESLLDKGRGSAWLSQPAIATLISDSIKFFNMERYILHAWTIMPNHVHVLLTPNSGENLSQIVHSWKSFSANKANRLLRRTGPFWQREFFDRFVRNEEHFYAAVKYIDHNPVKAGLCNDPSEWRFGSASARMITVDFEG